MIEVSAHLGNDKESSRNIAVKSSGGYKFPHIYAAVFIPRAHALWYLSPNKRRYEMAFNMCEYPSDRVDTLRLVLKIQYNI